MIHRRRRDDGGWRPARCGCERAAAAAGRGDDDDDDDDDDAAELPRRGRRRRGRRLGRAASSTAGRGPTTPAAAGAGEGTSPPGRDGHRPRGSALVAQRRPPSGRDTTSTRRPDDDTTATSTLARCPRCVEDQPRRPPSWHSCRTGCVTPRTGAWNTRPRSGRRERPTSTRSYDTGTSLGILVRAVAALPNYAHGVFVTLYRKYIRNFNKWSK